MGFNYSYFSISIFAVLFASVASSLKLNAEPDIVKTMPIEKPYIDGIYPNIREKGCGHKNLQVPQLLQHEGGGQYIVDVGLGDTADETFAAVRKNFIVLGFEPSPANIRSIKQHLKQDLKDKVQFIYPEKDESGAWIFPPIEKPETQGGFAFIFQAGLSNETSTTEMDGSHQSLVGQVAFGKLPTEKVPVAITTLDKVLPGWAFPIQMLKIDTQGWEQKILQGGRISVRHGRFKYVQYEFSPWLMEKAGVDKVGQAKDLLFWLPQRGGMCFDMMGEHHKLSRPTSPLKAYLDSLNSTRNSTHGSYCNVHGKCDPIGPWDDIMCCMQCDGSVENRIQQVLKDVCVKQP